MTVLPPRPELDKQSIQKSPTGIWGLDEVTGGGLPAGRPTLITGSAGCGKTLFGIEFLVHGAVDYGEPGVLLAFEEAADDLVANVASLGFDLAQMQADGQLVIDAFRVDPAEVVETGAYDLEGLFIRLAYAVDSIGAKRVVLDTIEVLFAALHDEATIRAEMGRLFRWLKARGLTAIVTGERGMNAITRHGIEEYVSDCVIVLDHRVHEELSTRRLRVVKYRGSRHGANEYPFIISESGIVVLPLSAVGLEHDAPTERITTGVPRLDHMLGGGVYRGSSVLISGEAGTGKTTLAARAVEAACERGERALFVSLEESPAQLMRDMASVGIDLARWHEAGLLSFWSGRPSAYGLELHLATLLRMLDDFAPSVVALDAMTALLSMGEGGQVNSAVTRELDALKSRGVTAFVTTLTHAGESDGETSSVAVTSLMDTWLLLRNLESNGERNRLLFVRKSRGTAHSNQVREFVLSDHGVDLVDVYIGNQGMLTGSARLARAAQEQRAVVVRHEEVGRRRRVAEEHAKQVEAQIALLQSELDAEVADLQAFATSEEKQQNDSQTASAELAAQRWADPAGTSAAESGESP